MKNSTFRRLYFSVMAKARFMVIALKNKESFTYKNHFEPFWGRFWSYKYSKISGIKSEYYIPEVYFYNKLEKNINDFSLANYFEHKGYLKDILGSNTIPNVINYISGVYYNDNGNSLNSQESINSEFALYNNNEFVIKRSIGTGGGKSVEIGNLSYINRFIKSYEEKGYDFVVQPRINQHKELRKFNDTSINTIRILSLSHKGEINIISTVFRMGNGGKIDNSASGGISIGCDYEGNLNKFAIDHDFNKFYVHPYSGIDFLEENKIPNFDAIKNVVIEKHAFLKSHGLVSWDISIDDEDNISILEFNVIWSEINFHQANNGPVFSNYINYVDIYK